MKIQTLALAIASVILLGGCGSDEGSQKSDPAAYNKCLETEAAKWLDETGSNLDYANEKATAACANLK
jgi:uncharacterized protein YceK